MTRSTLIDKLEFILALARERHFGRAAEACGDDAAYALRGRQTPRDTNGRAAGASRIAVPGLHAGRTARSRVGRRIIGDTRTMREEVSALRHGLIGRLRIAAIPTALAMVASLTTPYRAIYAAHCLPFLSHLELAIHDTGKHEIARRHRGR